MALWHDSEVETREFMPCHSVDLYQELKWCEFVAESYFFLATIPRCSVLGLQVCGRSSQAVAQVHPGLDRL